MARFAQGDLKSCTVHRIAVPVEVAFTTRGRFFPRTSQPLEPCIQAACAANPTRSSLAFPCAGAPPARRANPSVWQAFFFNKWVPERFHAGAGGNEALSFNAGCRADWSFAVVSMRDIAVCGLCRVRGNSRVVTNARLHTLRGAPYAFDRAHAEQSAAPGAEYA